MDIFLDRYFYFHCYMEDDKIRQEITKVCHTKKEITCVVFQVKEIDGVRLGGAADKVRSLVNFCLFLGITAHTNTQGHVLVEH